METSGSEQTTFKMTAAAFSELNRLSEEVVKPGAPNTKIIRARRKLERLNRRKGRR